jgi:hypothetical protein
MCNDPGGELRATLDFVKEMMPRATTSDIENATSTPLTDSSDKENSPIDPPAQPNTNNDATSSSPTKKKARPSNDSNEFVINISLPEDGKMYRVEVAINIFMHVQANVADLSQSSNLNTHRSNLSAYKKAMLKYLPIKMRAFNNQIRNASKPGVLSSLTGKGWDDKGRPTLLLIDELLQTQTEQQASHANKGWEKSDTEAALIDAAKRKKTEKGLDPTVVQSVDIKTTNSYHNALATHPDNKIVLAHPKPDHRLIAELSWRGMMSNAAGMVIERSLPRITEYYRKRDKPQRDELPFKIF